MSQARHALVEKKDRKIDRYCSFCGAKIDGPGRWGHDDDCPRKEK